MERDTPFCNYHFLCKTGFIIGHRGIKLCVLTHRIVIDGASCQVCPAPSLSCTWMETRSPRWQPTASKAWRTWLSKNNDQFLKLSWFSNFYQTVATSGSSRPTLSKKVALCNFLSYVMLHYFIFQKSHCLALRIKACISVLVLFMLSDNFPCRLMFAVLWHVSASLGALFLALPFIWFTIEQNLRPKQEFLDHPNDWFAH